MAVPLSLGPVHHLRLTVTDVDRSRTFYTDLLQGGIVRSTATCCSGCARWTPSGPTIVSIPSAAAWTT
jgi:hypothetical protein